MRKILLILAVCSVTGFGQFLISGRVTSSAYSFTRFDTLLQSTSYVRGYQQSQLNFGYQNLSLHTSFNYENSYTKKMDYDPRLRFNNLYLESSKMWNFATFRLGRQPIYSALAGGVFDGLSAKLSSEDIIFDGFVGANIPAYQELKMISDWKDNNIIFSRLRYFPSQELTLGVSYVSKKFKSTDYRTINEIIDPIKAKIFNNSQQFEYLNAEASYEKDKLYLRTKYELDLNFAKTSKAEIECESPITGSLSGIVYTSYREPRINYNSIFSVFDFGSTVEAEGGLSYELMKNYSVSGRFGYTRYKDDNASRANVSYSTPYGSLSYRKTFGYAGELSSVSANTAYTFMSGAFTPSFSVSYTNYKLSADGPSQNLLSTLAGCNIRPLNYLSVDLQAQYMDNVYYKKDVRFLVKLNYWFHTVL